MTKSKREILEKILKDTESDKIVWDVILENKYVKAIFEQNITPSKQLVFKLLYYIDHPKSTKLHVYFKRHDKRGSQSDTIIDLGGHKKRNEAKFVARILNKILLKEEELRNKINIDLDDDFKIGDRIVVVKEQDFQRSEIISQKGTIVNIFNDNEGDKILVEFDNKFSDILINKDFEPNINRCSDGNCWIMNPENIRKIN